MQAIKLTLAGRYWDSQLYKGDLYLFDLKGSVRVLDWSQLIGSLVVPERCRLALECAYLRSDYLYGDKWDKLFRDSEIRDLLASKFDELLTQTLVISENGFDSFTTSQVDTPFPFAHNDCLCYNDYIYAASQSGVYATEVHPTIISRQARLLSDLPVSSFDINHDVFALAAGDAGLFRAPSATYSTYPHETLAEARLVQDRLCNDCSYIHSSILSFGFDVGASLTEFRSPKRNFEIVEKEIASDFWKATPIGTIEGEQIFGENTTGAFCWGSRNRMCMAKDGRLRVAKYMTTNPRRRSVATVIRTIDLEPWKGSPVSGDNAVFGAILELDNCVVVVRSDDKVDTLRGEPTNWRVFPRSKYYVNQLHLVYDDRIEILSFNHDYFVDQGLKSFGEPHIEPWFSRSRRL